MEKPYLNRIAACRNPTYLLRFCITPQSGGLVPGVYWTVKLRHCWSLAPSCLQRRSGVPLGFHTRSACAGPTTLVLLLPRIAPGNCVSPGFCTCRAVGPIGATGYTRNRLEYRDKCSDIRLRHAATLRICCGFALCRSVESLPGVNQMVKSRPSSY